MKNRMKQGLSLLLSAGLLLSLLTGCGRSGSASTSGAAESQPVRENAVQEEVVPTVHNEDAPDKAETVYVKADPDGTVTRISVETVLKNPGDGQPILDRTNLSDIRNTEGDEEFTQSGSDLTWENHGEDIHYKGESGQPLPVNVSVSYYLDGAPIAPEELAGKSGSVRIRFDYENTTSQTVTVQKKVLKDDLEDLGDDVDLDAEENFEYRDETLTVPVPFAAITALFLPGDVFYNVEVTNGEAVTSDDQTIVIGYAMPGLADALGLGDYELTEEIELPDCVEITADVVGFELDFTTTIVTNGLLSDLEEDDLYEADELVAGTKLLGDFADALADGTDELYDGLGEFSDYLTQYTQGVSALSDGAKQLSDVLRQVDARKNTLMKKLGAVRTSLEAVTAAASSVQEQDPEGYETASAALNTLLADTAQLAAALEGAEGSLTEIEQYISAAAGYVAAVQAATAAADGELNAIDLSSFEATAKAQVTAALADTDLSEEQKAAIVNSIDLGAQRAVAQAHLDAARAALAAIPQWNAPEAGPDLDGLSALVAEMQGQIAPIQSYGAELSDQIQPLLPALEQAVSDLAKDVQSASQGGNSLSDGIDALDQGITQLAKGASGLSDGASKLDSAGQELSKAFREALDGVKELRDGFRTFDEEGIRKLTDLAGDDLGALIAKVKALRLTDDAYDNFSGLREDQTGSVRFIIETAEIKN